MVPLLLLAAAAGGGTGEPRPHRRLGAGGVGQPPTRPPNATAAAIAAAAVRRRLQGKVTDTACPVGAGATASNRPMPAELTADSLQITVTEVARDLIAQINSGADGLIINEAISSFRGALGSAGTYTVDEQLDNGAPYCIPRSGIVISTGAVIDYAPGPSEGPTAPDVGDTFWGTAHGDQRPLGDDTVLLNRISDERALASAGTGGFGGTVAGFHDVTRLDLYFAVDPSRVDLELTFDLVFGSEEYAQFAGTAFVDAFGIFVNGFNVAEFAGQPLNIDHSDMRFFAGTELNGVCAAGGNDPVLQKVYPMTGKNCGQHTTASTCQTETFGQTEGCVAGVGCDYTVCHWEPSDGVCYNTLTYIIADTFDEAVDSTVYIMSLGADVDCSGVTPPANGRFCAAGCSSDACLPTGELLDKTECVFECDPGYTYQGFVSCRTGSWVNRARCVPDPCMGIMAPSHGSLVGTCADGQLSSGQSCNVWCDDGYEISDGVQDAVVSCSAGILMPVVPTCSDLTPPLIDCDGGGAAAGSFELSPDGACVNVNPASFIGSHVTATDVGSPPGVTSGLTTTCFDVRDGSVDYHSLPFIATNQAGLTSTCDVHLYVWNMGCPADITIPTDGHGSTTAAFTIPNPTFRGLTSATPPSASITGPMFTGKVPGEVVDLDLATGSHQLTYTTASTTLASASCTVTVTVEDSEPPQLTCPSDLVMSAPATFDATQAATGPLALITATDNSGAVVGISACTPELATAGTCPNANIDTQNLAAQDTSYEIGFVATETNGLALTATCRIRIHVWDIACPASSTTLTTTASAGGRLVLPELDITGSTRESGATITVSVQGQDMAANDVHNFPVTTATTTYDVSYTAAIDEIGIGASQKSCISTVTVTDDLAPVITCPSVPETLAVQTGGAIEVDAASYIGSVVTATDNSGVLPTVAVASMAPTTESGLSGPQDVSVLSYSPGSYTLTFTATDADSNSASCSFDLHVWDVACPASLDLDTDLDRDYSTADLPQLTFHGLAAAPDVVDISIPTHSTSYYPGQPDVKVYLTDSGSSATYTASLASSPSDVKTCNVLVTVTDRQAPGLSCPESVILWASSTGLDAHWASVDVGTWLSNGDVTFSDNSGSGNVELSWQASESPSSFTDDTVPVTFSLQSTPQTLTLMATETTGLANATLCVVLVYVWSIACDDISAATSTGGTGDPVAAVTIPDLIVSGNVPAGSLAIWATKAGYTYHARDSVDIHMADAAKAITYHARDSAGASTTCVAQVTITDDESPVFKANGENRCPSSQIFPTDSGSASGTFASTDFLHGKVNASDNSGAAVTITYQLSSGITEAGDTWTMDASATPQTVTFAVTDGTNPPANCIVQVHVTDTDDPVFTSCPTDPAHYVRVVPDGSASESVAVTSAYFVTTGQVAATDNTGDCLWETDSQCRIDAAPSGMQSLERGVHSIVYTAKDTAGANATCSVPIHVWNVQCQNRTMLTIPCEPGQPYATLDLQHYTPDPSTGSTGGIALQTKVQFVGGQSDVILTPGTPETHDISLTNSGTVVSYVVHLENYGPENEKTCAITVTVEDTQDPEITCPSEIVLRADSSDSGSVTVADLLADGAVVFSDNSGAVNLTWQSGLDDTIVPVQFPLQAGAQTLRLTATETGGSLRTASCDVPVYVWDLGVRTGVCADWTEVTSSGTAGDAEAAVTIPFPTIRGAPAAAGADMPPSGPGNLDVTYALSCRVGEHNFEDATGVFTASQSQNLTLTDSLTVITYTATSTAASAAASTVWSDGLAATCIATITIEDDEHPVWTTCPDNVWVRSSNLTAEIANQAQLLLDEGNRLVATDNAGAPNITIRYPVPSSPFTGYIEYTATQMTERTVNGIRTRLSTSPESCLVSVKVWDIECPPAIHTSTSNITTVLGQDHGTTGNAHAHILIGPVVVLTPITVPSQNNQVTVTVDVPVTGSVQCQSLGYCGVVVEFPFPGGKFEYLTELPAWSDANNVVRVASFACSTDVTVKDDEDPTFDTCTAQTSVNTEPDQNFAIINPSTFEPATRDNSGLNVEMTSDVADGASVPLGGGSVFVNFTATDTSGNTANCTTEVTVQDSQPPTFTQCPQTPQKYPMELGKNSRNVSASQLLGVISADDNSGIDPNVTSPAGIDGNLTLRSGIHEVEFTATDAANNTDTCKVELDVECARVIGPIGANSGWRNPKPPNNLIAGQNTTFKVELKDHYLADYVEDATVKATFTTVGENLVSSISFLAQHLSGNVHAIVVNIPATGLYTGKATVTEHGGAEGVVAKWETDTGGGREVRAGDASELTTTVVGSVPVVRTAGQSADLVVQAMDINGNPLKTGGLEPQLSILQLPDFEMETLVDKADGTYSLMQVGPDGTAVPTTFTAAGSYNMEIMMGGIPLASSPIRIIILPEPIIDAGKSTAEGGSFDLPDQMRIPWFDPAACPNTAAAYIFFDIVPRDRFRNVLDAVSSGSAIFTVETTCDDETEVHPDMPVSRSLTKERYQARVTGVHSAVYTLIIRLNSGADVDPQVGGSYYRFKFEQMPCPSDVSELESIRDRLQASLLEPSNQTVIHKTELQLHVTYQWNERLALMVQLAAVISFTITVIIVLKVWKLRLTEAVNLAGPTWMMCIGFGCMLSCVSVIIFSSGQTPTNANSVEDPDCDWEECALGEISGDIRVSDEFCLLKDATPSLAFTMIWASIIVKLRRTYVSVVKQQGLSDCRLFIELFFLILVQVAIKGWFYHTDPPMLHIADDYRTGVVQPAPLDAEGELLFPNETKEWRVNPHFYCYSGSAAKYWAADTAYHALLLLLAVMLAIFNKDIASGDANSKRGANSFEKLLTETGNVLAASYTVGMLMVLTEFMQAQVYLNWEEVVVLQAAFSLGSAMGVIFWVFVPKIHQAGKRKAGGYVSPPPHHIKLTRTSLGKFLSDCLRRQDLADEDEIAGGVTGLNPSRISAGRLSTLSDAGANMDSSMEATGRSGKKKRGGANFGLFPLFWASSAHFYRNLRVFGLILGPF